MKFYIDFVSLTSKQYEHCTLEEKLSVYVQHRPACVVSFLQELINRVNELERQVAISLECLEEKPNEDRNHILEEIDRAREEHHD